MTSRFAIFVSGRGTNLQALIDSRECGDLAPATLEVVIVNRPGAPAIERAQRAGIPTVVIDHKQYPNRAEFESAVTNAIDEHRAEAIVLAGFMRILSPEFVSRYRNRIINTHPALCPSFPGLDAPAQAIDYGAKISGCTVHFVDSGVDSGPVIFQTAVDIRDNDDATTLHKRIQAHEHRLLPQAVRLMAAGRLHIHGRQVTIADA